MGCTAHQWHLCSPQLPAFSRDSVAASTAGSSSLRTPSCSKGGEFIACPPVFSGLPSGVRTSPFLFRKSSTKMGKLCSYFIWPKLWRFPYSYLASKSLPWFKIRPSNLHPPSLQEAQGQLHLRLLQRSLKVTRGRGGPGRYMKTYSYDLRIMWDLYGFI